MKPLRQTIAIAGTTARELVRNPAYAVLVGCGAALIALSPAFAVFHLGEQVKLIADLGLGTALLVGLLIGVLGASWAVNEELESLSALAILAKPVSRMQFLLGKYFGVLAAAAEALVVLFVALLFTLRAIAPDAADARLFLYCLAASVPLVAGGSVLFARPGMRSPRPVLTAALLVAAALGTVLGSHGVLAFLGRHVGGWSWPLVPAFAGVIFQVAVLAAVAVALATRLTLTANLPVIFAVFVLGQLAGQARAGGGAASVLAWLLPDLGTLQFSDAVARHLSKGEFATGPAVPPEILAGAAAVAVAYVAGALAVGGALFRRRDLQ